MLAGGQAAEGEKNVRKEEKQEINKAGGIMQDLGFCSDRATPTMETIHSASIY